MKEKILLRKFDQKSQPEKSTRKFLQFKFEYLQIKFVSIQNRFAVQIRLQFKFVILHFKFVILICSSISSFTVQVRTSLDNICSSNS